MRHPPAIALQEGPKSATWKAIGDRRSGHMRHPPSSASGSGTQRAFRRGGGVANGGPSGWDVAQIAASAPGRRPYATPAGQRRRGSDHMRHLHCAITGGSDHMRHLPVSSAPRKRPCAPPAAICIWKWDAQGIPPDWRGREWRAFRPRGGANRGFRARAATICDPCQPPPPGEAAIRDPCQPAPHAEVAIRDPCRPRAAPHPTPTPAPGNRVVR